MELIMMEKKKSNLVPVKLIWLILAKGNQDNIYFW